MAGFKFFKSVIYMKFKILEEYNKNLMYIDDILNKSTVTNNLELHKLGTLLFGELFIGVYSADKFPKYIKKQSDVYHQQ